MKRDKAYYMISVVSKRFDVHPQTLRLYEREGLLKPSRTEGNTRLYSDEDIARLRLIQRAMSEGVPVGRVRAHLQTPGTVERLQAAVAAGAHRRSGPLLSGRSPSAIEAVTE